MQGENNLTIFYTDDDSEDKALFKEILLEIHPEISLELQSDGLELLNKLEKADPPPDLLFLDINMPNKDGFQVLSALKTDQQKKHIPVIMLSTSNNDQVISRAKSLGATLYVCKPNSYGKFRGILKNIFSHDWRHGNHDGAWKEFVYC